MTLSRALIIAEAGVNHNGNLEKAFELIDAAVYAGADIIKFQTFDSLLLASKSAPQARYQSKNIGFSQSQRDMLQSLELPKSCYSQLVSYCQERGLEFLSSAFDFSSIETSIRLILLSLMFFILNFRPICLISSPSLGKYPNNLDI